MVIQHNPAIRLLLLTVGCWAAIVELMEMGRWIAIVAADTWNWWYIAEYALIITGIITIIKLLSSEWRRR